MAGFISLLFTLIVVPATVFCAYCDYILIKDCYHTTDTKHVCGTNGKTYRNHCQLAQAYCQDSTVHKAHDGDCLTVSTTPNPIHGSEIALDIFCMDISYLTCGPGGPPVCATDGNTYPNMCEFDKAKCTHRNIQPNATCPSP